jgi:hypothetical protein
MTFEAARAEILHSVVVEILRMRRTRPQDDSAL